jgi:type VI secretion system protein VasG
MADVNQRAKVALFDKLNPLCRDALKNALGLCVSRTNYEVEIEHWLLKLIEPANGDVARLLKHYDVLAGQVTRELLAALEPLKTGNAARPELALELLKVMSEAWQLATLEYGASRIRSGYLLVGLFTDRVLLNRIRQSAPTLAKINADDLRENCPAVIAGSAEDEPEQPAVAAAPGAGPAPAAKSSKTPALDQYTQDLTAAARAKKIDPVIGRDPEIRQVIDILTRRRQNNPILVGEAGVGKTAVVEGFALRIVGGDVPEPLKTVSLRSLDLGLLQAGAGVKGEFENRLKQVIAEVQASPKPVILFIDEAHTLIGAGGAAGTGDAANLLKPALARGELRTVAATTFVEYKKSFEDDPALKRRFQMVTVDEPDRPRCVAMLRGISASLEKHHGVRVLEEAMDEAVRLSQRYVPDRQLPDKAVSVLDTACARVRLSQTTTPAALEDARRTIERLSDELSILTREQEAGADHARTVAELTEQKTAAEERRTKLEAQWAKEAELAGRVRTLRQKLEAGGDAAAEADRVELAKLTAELAEVQGESPLVQPVVNGQAVAEVIASWTGIPLGKMVRNEINALLTLGSRLKDRVVGQDHAIEVLAERVQTARAKLTDPRRPIGSFLLVGPSGVGKTETALVLSDILFGGERGLTVINMSEYKEDFMVSRLTGPAPGLVGYGKGGVLTEAVRRKPNSIVLLDEIEKANVAVQELFYQVFDKGTLQDEKGQETDFKNTILLLTSNVGTDTIAKLCADPETAPDADALSEALRPDLLKVFKPAFLGRLTVLPYFPLGDEVLRRIIGIKLKQVKERVAEGYRAAFTVEDAVTAELLKRSKEVESGARNVDRIINVTLLPELSRLVLNRLAEGRPIDRVAVGLNADGTFRYDVG